MFEIKDVLETTRMITENNLDVRTITMGISLRDCAHPDIKVTAQKIYDKVTKKAENLVKVGQELETELGVPIINKRVSVTPVAIVGESCDAASYVPLLTTQAAPSALILSAVFPHLSIRATPTATAN